MQYCWKNHPIACQGSFIDKDENRSIILEAIAYQRLWIWHAYFRLLGSNNNLNALNNSPLIWEFLGNVHVDLNFQMNNNVHFHYYLLVDNTYPWWSCFDSTTHEPQKHQHFVKLQEVASKDVECHFGVLKSKWQIMATIFVDYGTLMSLLMY
jgi:hypothetical protein